MQLTGGKKFQTVLTNFASFCIYLLNAQLDVCIVHKLKTNSLELKVLNYIAKIISLKAMFKVIFLKACLIF